MNILVDIIPAAWRKYVLYAPFAAVSLVLGAWDVAAGSNDPTWLPPAITVTLFVGTALGLTAYGNTADNGSAHDQRNPG